MSLTDYSQLEGQITDAPEPEILRRGEEVKARIINVRTGVDKNDLMYFMPVFDVPDNPLVLEFTDYFTDLTDFDKLEEKQQMRALHKFQKFAAAFGIDYAKPFDFDDFIKLEGWLIVGTTKSEQYGEQNSVAKYVVRGE